MKWKQQKSNIAIGILFLIAFVVVLRNPAVSFPDSQGYLEMHIIRTSGYPLFLQFVQSIFGDYFETATVTIQLLFGCFSIYYFIYKLRSNQILNDFFSVCLAFVLLLPFITGLKIANNILTESLSYSLYLIIVAKFMAFFLTKKVKELYAALPILAILLITRYQFVFFIPLGLGLIFWVSYFQKSFKKYALISVLFISLPLITSLVDKTYHKIIHDHFVSTPWTGMSVITPILFVADAEDAAVLETTKEKEFFNNVYQDLAENQMNINHLQVPSNDTPTMYYIKNYANIQIGPILKNGEALIDSTLSKTEKFIALDQFINKVSKPLLFDNFSKWRRIYTGNAIFGFGGFKYALLYFLIAIFSFIALLKRDQTEYKIIGLSSLLVIGNVLIVAIGMHAVVRFTFYSDWVLFFTIFVLLNSLNKKRYES